MNIIRLMTPADLSTVATLDALAFKTVPRTQSHLEASLALYPKGCFVVALGDGTPVGYLFSRQRGRLGWLGVGGVHPDYQGQGYGKALMSRAIQPLQAAGCGVIGLSTQTPTNIGTWASLGFTPGLPTLEMTKPVSASGAMAAVQRFSDVDRGQALEAIQHLSQTVQPGLDYQSEVINAQDYGWGETLLFGWPHPWAFVLLRTEPIRPQEVRLLQVAALVLPNPERQRLPEMLHSLEHFAGEHQFEQMALFVDTSAADALPQALQAGLRVKSLWIRMAWHQAPPPAMGVDLSLWAM